MTTNRERREAVSASIAAKNRLLRAVDANGQPLPPPVEEAPPGQEALPVEDVPLAGGVSAGQGPRPGSGPALAEFLTVRERIAAKNELLRERMREVRTELDGRRLG